MTPVETAGLKWPPEICPPANTMTISTEPMASGANAPTWVLLAVTSPTVSTRKKVPMNSTTSLR